MPNDLIIIDPDTGQEFIVGTGIGENSWATYRRKKGGSLQRVKSRNLPERPDKESAERDLRRWLGIDDSGKPEAVIPPPARAGKSGRNGSRLFDLTDAVEIRLQSLAPRQTYDVRMNDGRIKMLEADEVPEDLAKRAIANGPIAWTRIHEDVPPAASPKATCECCTYCGADASDNPAHVTSGGNPLCFPCFNFSEEAGDE